MREQKRPVLKPKVVVLTVLPFVGLATWVACDLRRPRRPFDPTILGMRVLSQCAEAQTAFRKKDRYGIGREVYANPVDGTGFPDLYQIGGPGSGGATMGLISLSVARATAPSRALYGFYLVDIVGDKNGLFDFTKECGLCAVPVDPTKLTFIINASGDGYQKPTGGRPVTLWPDVESEGWR